MSRHTPWTIALAMAIAPSLAAAAPGASVSGSADASADAGDPPNDGRRLSARGDTRRNDKWIHRWAPQRNMLELGIYGGVWFPSPHLELFGPDPDLPRFGNQRLKTVAPEIGLRAAYFPLRFHDKHHAEDLPAPVNAVIRAGVKARMHGMIAYKSLRGWR